MQVPTLGVAVLPGVKAHFPSVPPQLQASLKVYEPQIVLTMQVVPFETHPVPIPDPDRTIEQSELVVNMKSSQTLTLQTGVPVVYPIGKA